MSESEPAIRLRALHRRFGSVTAVDHVDLDVRDGEFLTLLGPSGSGKTTVLRLIAGFERPDGGTIELGGVDVTGLPPYARDVNTVFQDYALFPHMSVLENVAYGLRVKKVSKSERVSRAEQALAGVQLSGMESRRPDELSGGQRQRVALARALVNRPRVLLLDEPLGALDLKLREAMQGELASLQREVGITFVFVTHDQDEALTMSDRIAVFNNGRIEQLGTPAEVYERPATEFVAGFVGSSNVVRGAVAEAIVGTPGTWSIRPEKVVIGPPPLNAGSEVRSAAGRVRDVVYVGSTTRISVDLDAGSTMLVVCQNTGMTGPVPTVGQRVDLHWQVAHEYSLAESSG